jgi:hypothetical protein
MATSKPISEREFVARRAKSDEGIKAKAGRDLPKVLAKVKRAEQRGQHTYHLELLSYDGPKTNGAWTHEAETYAGALIKLLKAQGFKATEYVWSEYSARGSGTYRVGVRIDW